MNMLFAESSLGIQFNRDRVDLVLLARGLRTRQLLASTSVPLTPQGSFYAEGVDGVVQKLAGVLTPSMRQADSIQMGIFRALAVTQAVETPQVSAAESRQIMAHELERQVPFATADVYWDAQPAGAGTGALMKLLLAAVPRPRLDPFLTVAHQLGLTLGGVELSCTAAAAVAAAPARETDLDVMVNLEADETEVSVRRGGLLVHSRLFRPRAAVETAAEDPWGTFVDELWTEIRASLAAAGAAREPAQIHLFGPRAVDPALAPRLTRTAGVRAAYLNPFGEIAGASLPVGQAFARVAALGLALHGSARRPGDLNLLPAGQRAVRSARGIVASGVLLGLILALLVAWAAGGFWKLRIEREGLAAGVRALEPEVRDTLAMGDLYQRVEAQVAEIHRYETQMPPKIELLRELSEIIPDGAGEDPGARTWITFLGIDGSDLTIKGKSEAPEGLLKILDDSPYFEKVRFDSSVAGDNFSIKATISRSPTLDEASTVTTPTPSPVPSPTPTPTSRSVGGQAEEPPPPEPESSEERGPAYRLPTATPVEPTAAPPPAEEPPAAGEPSQEELTEEERARQSFLEILRNSRGRTPPPPAGEEGGQGGGSFLDILRGATGRQQDETEPEPTPLYESFDEEVAP